MNPLDEYTQTAREVIEDASLMWEEVQVHRPDGTTYITDTRDETLEALTAAAIRLVVGELDRFTAGLGKDVNRAVIYDRITELTVELEAIERNRE